jgi:hypothetical protein
MTKNYAVDDGDGDRLTAGVPENRIEAVAQSLANDLGEPVWYYETGEGEKDAEAVRVDPEKPAI